MHSLRLRLRGGPSAAAAARAALRDAELVEGLPDALRDDLELLVTEVVSNSVRHAGADEVRLGVQLAPGAVRVRCCDGGPGFPARPRTPSLSGRGGFGLVLVDRLSSRWGVSRRRGGACVWFELPADHSGASSEAGVHVNA